MVDGFDARDALLTKLARAFLVGLLAMAPLSSVAQGTIDAFPFDNAAQEARFRALSEELRCPKCLNTNLAGSDAPIAADLRSTVHRLILEGATDQEVRDYLQARYGDFVLYDPPVRRGTLLLWIAPALLLAIGLTAIAVMTRRRRGATESLSDAERTRLEALLQGPSGTGDKGAR